MDGAGDGGGSGSASPEPGEGAAAAVDFHDDEEIIEVLELNEGDPDPGVALNTGTLVALMEDFPLLWDDNSAQCADRQEKDRAWDDLSQLVYGDRWENGSAEERAVMSKEIRREWRSCRDAYREEIRAVPKSGDCGSQKVPYPHLQALQYLKPTTNTRPTKDRLPSEQEAEQEGSEEESAGEGTSAAVQPPAKRRRGRPTNRKRERRLVLEKKAELWEAVSRCLREYTPPTDAAGSFGQYVSTELRALNTSERLVVQSYISYLLWMATPPNNPLELYNLMDQLRRQERLRRQAMASAPPPTVHY